MTRYSLHSLAIILVISTGFILTSRADCSVNSTGIYRFGSKCQYVCHCTGGVSCNTTTGKCPNTGCDTNWFGNDCQKRDLALNQFSRHSSNLQDAKHQYSNLAHNGDPTKCSSTIEVKHSTDAPWWRIWFPQNETIKDIYILTKTYTLKYFPNYKVTVEYLPKNKQGDPDSISYSRTCYQQDDTEPGIHEDLDPDTDPSTSLIKVQCNQPEVGNHVKIQLATTNSQLVLCDVRIRKECSDNQWGSLCENTCGACRISTCDPASGICYGGCQDGYKMTDMCDLECDDGRYGYNCQGQCSAHCKIPPCDKRSGACIGGCGAGYSGVKCDQECSGGTYGFGCNQTCSVNCLDVCNKVSGTCSCKPGWKGPLCDQECDDGTYGNGCAFQCVDKCPTTCNNVNGYCPDCPLGLKGNLCEEECTPGFYGENCAQNCSIHCVESCNIINGHCNCSTGWQGVTCHKACDVGSHGDGCLATCGRCKNGAACNNIDGACALGCEPGYSGTLCATKIDEPVDSSSPVGLIAGVCSAVVVIATIVVVVVIMLRRRRQSTLKSRNSGIPERKEKVWENVSSEVTASTKPRASSKQDPGIYENSVGLVSALNQQEEEEDGNDKSNNDGPDSGYYTFGSGVEKPHAPRAILVTELAEFVKSKMSQENFFEDEFNDIPYGLQHPTLDARKPGNVGKNRYKALYAYDHSRVILNTLPSQPHSDYVNASFIKGYKKDKAYIAAQGPTVNNVHDFWRMIWENDVKLIAMVTNLVEETKMKCLQYWVPVGKSKTFGHVTVHTDSKEEFAEFIVRRFQISYEGETRKKQVVQYAYTAWPDKGVPNSTCSLLHFWQKVRKQDKNKSKPWLVHCSAGVGRTGTFIALDYLYEQGIDTGYVDVNMCVRNLRDQRVNMVQVKEQYEYLYRIMVEALVIHSTPVSIHQFESFYTDALTVETTGKTKLQQDFETMEDGDILVTNLAKRQENNDDKDTYTNAKKLENKAKNRYSNILAADEFRPFLSTQVPGTNNYINAVYMPSYSDLHGYLITQTPLPDTAVDCCRLVIEQEIHVIVTFDNNGENPVGLFLPATGSVDIGPFNVTMASEEMNEGYVIRKHTLTYKSKDHTIVQLDYQDWPLHSSVPKKPSNVLKMLHEVDGLQRQYENKPVLAQCFNGAERSGLFVVLMNVIERARIDEEVSIPQIIRYLRTRRKIIQNYEQFKFCHDVFRCYAESNSTYANM